MDSKSLQNRLSQLMSKKPSLVSLRQAASEQRSPEDPSPSPPLETADYWKERDPSCPCASIINPDTTTCCLCLGQLPQFKLLQKKNNSLKELNEESKAKIKEQSILIHDQILQIRDLNEKGEDLTQEVQHKNKELVSISRDIKIMGEKLVDEIEKRAELQHSTENVQEELANLTQTLFEQANNMVRVEKVKSHNLELKEKSLEDQLIELRSRHAIDQAQLKELKLTLMNLRREDPGVHLSNKVRTLLDVSSPLAPSQITNGKDASFIQYDDIDEPKLAVFREFLRCSKEKDTSLEKLLKLSFLKTSYSEDIEPCLTFSATNKSNTKKIFEAIISDSCFIQDQSHKNKRYSSTTIPPNFHPIEQKDPSPPPQIVGKTLMGQISSFGFGSLSTSSSVTSINNLNASTDQCQLCQKHIQTPLYHLKLSQGSTTPQLICSGCRGRLIACCEFYVFVRNIQQGLFTKKEDFEIWWEFCLLKNRLFWARSGANLIPMSMSEKPLLMFLTNENEENNNDDDDDDKPLALKFLKKAKSGEGFSLRSAPDRLQNLPILGMADDDNVDDGDLGEEMMRDLDASDDESGDIGGSTYENEGQKTVTISRIMGDFQESFEPEVVYGGDKVEDVKKEKIDISGSTILV